MHVTKNETPKMHFFGHVAADNVQRAQVFLALVNRMFFDPSVTLQANSNKNDRRNSTAESY